jgi:hypothetical protein
MFIETVYDKYHIIPADCESNFTAKTELNTIEKVGLEAIAVEFMYQHDLANYGIEGNRDEIRSFIRWNENSVDILDGYYDTYEFDGFLIGSFWMTENGIPMMTAFEIPEDCEDWRDCDYLCDFPARFIRLF